jgi:ATP-binding cassette subfamily B protein
MNGISPLTWPLDSREEAVAAVARATGLSRPDTEEIEAEFDELDSLLRAAPPALLRLEIDGKERLLAVARRRGSRLIALAPDGTERAVPLRTISRGLAAAARASMPPKAELMGLLAKTLGNEPDEPAGRRRRAASELAPPARIRGCWTLRGRDGLGGLAREARLGRWAAPLLAAHALQLGLWITAWVIIASLAARADFGAPDLSALALVLGTMIAGRAVETHAARMAALGAGTEIKRRLLDGALALEPDEVRRQGIGRYLGRVLDAEAIETAGLTGAFLAIDAVGGVAVSAMILRGGAGGAPHALLLLGWSAGVAALSALAWRRRRRWTEARLALTAQGVEEMAGHQTRLAQADPSRRHDRDDVLLERYVAGRRAVDRATIAVELGRRSWMYVGLLALAGPFVAGTASGTAFVVSVGGLLLGYQALSNGTQSLARLSAAVIALQNLKGFWAGDGRREGPVRGATTSVARDAAGPTEMPILEARDVGFCHAGRREPVIRQAGLAIGGRDHVLLVGPSGSGKSTLAALLAGLRRPDAGLLLLRGLDRDTVGGERWRRAIVLAPQFHENHLLVGTLAYNLLLGRRWPPTASDLEEAAALCEDLGLGPLVARMPLGLHQPVGETGWQLSHGERSRVFAARAILQRPDLLILDESFAALDPGTLARTLGLVLARSSAVMLIAHP